MKIRLHKNSLVASMQTIEEIPRTKAAIKQYLVNKTNLKENELDSLEIRFYCNDRRTDWQNTYIVTITEGVLAFTNSEILD